MKIIITLLLLTALILPATAQIVPVADDSAHAAQPAKDIDYHRNIAKINVSSLLMNNYSLFYERLIGKKVSIVAGFRYMPKTRFGNTLIGKNMLNILNIEADEAKNARASNHSTLFGFRFYTGRKPGATGFYAELYSRFTAFSFDYDYHFTKQGKSYIIPVKGSGTNFNGGVLLGGQFKITKRMILDIYIIGGQLGSVHGDYQGTADIPALTYSEGQQIKNDLYELIPVSRGRKVADVIVDDHGVKGDIAGHFNAFRALGLNLGWTF